VYGPKRPWTAAILFKGDEMTDSNHASEEPVQSEGVEAIHNDETLTPAGRKLPSPVREYLAVISRSSGFFGAGSVIWARIPSTRWQEQVQRGAGSMYS
jgi:hypothetical protein